MSGALLPIGGLSEMAGPLAAVAAPHDTGPAQALKDFESLFVETLLQQAGLGQALEAGDSAEGGLAGELMVRELARNLADQLKLGFGQSLGLEKAQ
jgi:hypothetical protein